MNWFGFVLNLANIIIAVIGGMLLFLGYTNDTVLFFIGWTIGSNIMKSAFELMEVEKPY